MAKLLTGVSRVSILRATVRGWPLEFVTEEVDGIVGEMQIRDPSNGMPATVQLTAEEQDELDALLGALY